MHQLNVVGFTLDPDANLPLVLLKDREQRLTLPVWLSHQEALVLAAGLVSSELMGEAAGRPDLLGLLCAELQLVPKEIRLLAVQDGVCQFAVRLETPAGELELRPRAADALVLSLRHRLPVLASDELLTQAVTAHPPAADPAEDGASQLQELLEKLEKLKPTEMHKYPM